jgi:hypothetical protein
VRAEISVIIPTLNAEAGLPRCLTSLIEGLTAGIVKELVISDGGSSDATLKIADDAGAHVVQGPPSRGRQLRRGVAAARGQWLLVLHADTTLSPGWSEAVASHIASSSAPAHFRLAYRAGGVMPSLVAGWANLRSWLFGLPYGDQGLLMLRSDYDRSGGYPDQPLMEDVALVRGLPRAPVALAAVATTSADRYLRDGWFRRGGRNLWTLARYTAGADPDRLVRDEDRR